jgi:hypothetical protein
VAQQFRFRVPGTRTNFTKGLPRYADQPDIKT